KSAEGKLPFVDIDGEIIADSARPTVKKTYNLQGQCPEL
ncbi:MAG: hypothetical protein ACI9HY_002940, partial [Planctomycetaceae bacterium]